MDAIQHHSESFDMMPFWRNAAKLPQFWTTVQGFFDYQDLYKKIVTRCHDGDVVVEVGSFLGRSACFLGEEVQASKKNITVLAVDTWPSTYIAGDGSGVKIEAPFECFVANVRQSGLTKIVVPIRAESVWAAHFVRNELAVVFIDAEHDYTNCLADIMAWTPKVRAGGMICGHDYDVDSFPGVVKAANEYFGSKLCKMGRCWYVEV